MLMCTFLYLYFNSVVKKILSDVPSRLKNYFIGQNCFVWYINLTLRPGPTAQTQD